MNLNNDNGGDEDGDERPTCRICYGHDEPRDLLIVPCACRGSLEYVHASCLRGWLATAAANGEARRAQCSLCGTEHRVRRGACVASWHNLLATAKIIVGVGLDVSHIGVWIRGLSSGLVVLLAGGSGTFDFAVVLACRAMQVLGFFFFVGVIWWRASKTLEGLEREDMRIYDLKRGEYR